MVSNYSIDKIHANYDLYSCISKIFDSKRIKYFKNKQQDSLKLLNDLYFKKKDFIKVVLKYVEPFLKRKYRKIWIANKISSKNYDSDYRVSLDIHFQSKFHGSKRHHIFSGLRENIREPN